MVLVVIQDQKPEIQIANSVSFSQSLKAGEDQCLSSKTFRQRQQIPAYLAFFLFFRPPND